jgi:mRNA interferase HigB
MLVSEPSGCYHIGNMRVISRRVLTEFARKHKPAETPLSAWYTVVKAKKYLDSHQLKADFGTADFRRNGIVIFNIGGNKYRLVAHFRYDIGFVYIRHIVTHADYDKLTL